MADKKLKAELIKQIKAKGFPQAYQRGEADGTITFWLKSEKEVIGYDYAEGNYKLDELEIDELAAILKHSYKEGTEEYKDIMEYMSQ